MSDVVLNKDNSNFDKFIFPFLTDQRVYYRMKMKNINLTCLRPWPLLLAGEKGVEGNVGDLHNLEPETGTETRIRNAIFYLLLKHTDGNLPYQNQYYLICLETGMNICPYVLGRYPNNFQNCSSCRILPLATQDVSSGEKDRRRSSLQFFS